MRRALVLLALPLAAALAGCGDTCTATAADVSAVGSCSGTVSPGVTVDVPVRVCPTCSETNPSCSAELVGTEIQLNTVIQECQANAGCAASGCVVQPVICSFSAPATAGTYSVVAVDATSGRQFTTQITVGSGSGVSCPVPGA